MNKEQVLKYKHDEITRLKEEIKVLNSLELSRVFKFDDPEYRSWETSEVDVSESWGYIKAFNGESFRIQILASDSKRYSNKGSRRWKMDCRSFGYHRVPKMTRATREDIPLMWGMPFKSDEMEKLLHGRKRLKIDE